MPNNNRKSFHGRKLSFQIAGEFIGKGGNGCVFPIKLLDSEDKARYVVKFFSAEKFRSIVECGRRYHRFRKEIQEVEKFQTDVSGVMPIIDYCCPEECPGDNYSAWYIMPAASEFRVSERRSLPEKLEKMLQLAYIIKELHVRNKAHRDIKPDNILYYKNRLCLSDFGLIWTEEGEHITGLEAMGPGRIRPPEMMEGEKEIPDYNYQPSDVYLFAKVLWMYLKRDRYGFMGTYNRSEPDIYLNKVSYGVITMEPLHIMLERATHQNYEERITIDECIDWIHKQILVCKNEMPSEELQYYCYKENNAYFQASQKPDREVYLQGSSVHTYLNNVIEYSQVKFDDKGKIYEIAATRVQRQGERRFVFQQIVGNRIVKSFLCQIERLELEGDTAKILTEYFDDFAEDYIPFDQLGNVEMTISSKVVLNGYYELRIECKNKMRKS